MSIRWLKICEKSQPGPRLQSPYVQTAARRRSGAVALTATAGYRPDLPARCSTVEFIPIYGIGPPGAMSNFW